MRIRNAGLWFCCLIPLLAQTGEQREEWQRHWDQHWAEISRLPVAATEELRAAAGISNGSDSRIESLDAQTLKNRDHILLTERAGGCVTLHVLTDTATGYGQVWMLAAVPKYVGLGERGGNEKICSEEWNGRRYEIVEDRS